MSQIPDTREHPELAGRTGIGWSPEAIAEFDVVVIATDHDDVDYAALCQSAELVVDTRNACARAGIVSDNVVKA